MGQRFYVSVWTRSWSSAATLIALSIAVPVPRAAWADSSTFSGVASLGSSLQEVLHTMGSPRSIYLAGEDGEFPKPRVTDAVMMTYEKSIFDRKVFVWIELESCSVQQVSLRFADLIPVQELTARLGSEPRHERRALIPDPDGLEADVGSEHDPQGDVQVLVYPSLGIEAFFDLQGKGIELIEFGSAVNEQENFSGDNRCDRDPGR